MHVFKTRLVSQLLLDSAGVLLASLALLTLPHPSPAGAAIAVAPTVTSPADNAALTSFGPVLTWSNPGGTTQYHVQVIPANNDGPGVDVHVGAIGNSFAIPAPPDWYGLLPDMTYTWRVRVSDAAAFVALTDSSWSPWAELRFRTPKVSSATISPLTPAPGDTVTTASPALQFANSRSDVFYYELQLSKDATFNVDPATATAMVYASLLHGGVTLPRQTYAVPTSAPLEDKTPYFWRVRPRVQGDGAPLEWSPTYAFKTDFSAAQPVAVSVLSIGTVANTQGCTVGQAGSTFASAPDFTKLYYNAAYTGSGPVVRIWYWDNTPVTSVTVNLVAGSTCFRSNTEVLFGVPVSPGIWKLEMRYAGQVIQTTSVTVTETKALGLGAITAGTGVTSSNFCILSGTGGAFPAGTTKAYFRWNTVGSGDYTLNLYKGAGDTLVGWAAFTAAGPADCDWATYSKLIAGTWRLDLVENATNKVQQTVSFTVS